MAKQEISADSLALKTFVITVLGALLYITVVFVFIIGGNRREERAQQNSANATIAPEAAAPAQAQAIEAGGK